MKKYLIVLCALIAFAFAGSVGVAAEAPKAATWLRYPSISPNGENIAFCYEGDIYITDINGGNARQLTTNSAYDYRPIWSNTGKMIAFGSDREGSMDVYIISTDGGSPKRLTTHSSSEVPLFFLSDNELVYKSYVMPTAANTQFPGSTYPQLYKVSINGGRPSLYKELSMDNASMAPDGRILYNDIKGYEDNWRKHHTSSVTRDIWMAQNEKYSKLTSFKGEDLNPVWAPDYKSYYYLSEQNGTFNVFQCNIEIGSTPTEITKFTTHPVRFLSIAQNGTLCFTWNGDIYTQKQGSSPIKISIDIRNDNSTQEEKTSILYSGASEIAVSPKGKEIAFILRGDVYVTSIDYKTTKRITNTTEREKEIDFAPDGRSIAYASERNGVWQIYQSSIVSKDEEGFLYSTELKEENITKTDSTCFYPKYSPDGKELAFLRNRTEICVIDIKSSKIRTVMDGKFNYSYTDGDQSFTWSPDSKWILSGYIGLGGWNHTDIAMVKADGSREIKNLTNSGYSEGGQSWVLDGKAMIFASDRSGYRSHGSWGSEMDVYIMFFEQEAYERFKLDKEQLSLLEEKEKAEKKDTKKDSDTTKKDVKVKDLVFDLDYLDERTLRLTSFSGSLGSMLMSNDGKKLYYTAPDQGKLALWVKDLQDNKTELKIKDVGYGDLIPDKDGKTFYMASSGGIKKIDAASGKIDAVEFEAFYDHNPANERSYLLSHIYRQIQDKFYDPTLRNMDWAGFYKNYAQFLDHINNGYDFSDMVSEFLGELNASHTGCRFYAGGAKLKTAQLGVFLDETYSGDGLKIKEVIYNSPFALVSPIVKVESVITHIDGQPILAGKDYFPLLEGKIGIKTRFTIQPQKGKSFDVIIKPISAGAQSDLLYDRWVSRNEKMVDSLSNGRVAYVHIEGMNSPSFRTMYRKLLNDENRNKDAVIVDTRHNGGGWLHDDVATLLSGKLYARFTPRGQYVSDEPFNKWTKPSCMLIGEDNYSDAHGTPWTYKTLGIGKLIGAPVPGTMTAVWWESLPGNYVFGVPQVGVVGLDGKYLENQDLNPDILIYNTPETLLYGRDLQIEAAVKEMLKEASSKK